jgi:hypothetical protein
MYSSEKEKALFTDLHLAGLTGHNAFQPAVFFLQRSQPRFR